MADEGSVSSFSMGSVGSSSSTSDGNLSKTKEEKKKPGSSEELKRLQSMIKTETRTIRLWRLVILVTLLAAGAAVSTYTYLYLSDGEEQDYITAVS